MDLNACVSHTRESRRFAEKGQNLRELEAKFRRPNRCIRVEHRMIRMDVGNSAVIGERFAKKAGERMIEVLQTTSMFNNRLKRTLGVAKTRRHRGRVLGPHCNLPAGE